MHVFGPKDSRLNTNHVFKLIVKFEKWIDLETFFKENSLIVICIGLRGKSLLSFEPLVCGVRLKTFCGRI